ncbi:MAG TPA: flavin reductase [Pyrinomonadaceae bacterium]|jgi:predicted dehydrogenase/flavin reductase (DIM6/NTAB) family NADH-FMN oxidoreductase RutF|nr:flavin reductase [Pyrinomonadaceae bacterium]
MRWRGRTIWDTRVQDVCGVITASWGGETYLFASASFAQVSLDPPRVIINPNRTYGIDKAIQQSRRFAINILPATSRELMIKLMQTRRRQPAKERVLGLCILHDAHNIPYLDGNLRTVFCEVETTIDTGDRGLYIGNVLESRVNPKLTGSLPLLFSQATDLSKHPKLKRTIRTTASLTGTLDTLKVFRQKLRPVSPPNIARATYEEAGATTEEMQRILDYPTVDRGRVLHAPPAVVVPNKSVGICVVGTGWGQNHAKYLRWASPNVRLFICGRDRQKTDRVAKAVGATGAFYDLAQAITDERVTGLTFALPHHLHRNAVELAASAGKHALVEKPIATTLDDADAMIGAAQRAGTILMVAEDMHFRPAVRKAARLIEEGAIGEPLYFLAHAGGIRRPVGWAADKDLLGGGVLMDIGIHYVRALRLLMGEPETAFVSKAMQINTRMSGEDSAQIFFSSQVGWEAHLLCSWSTQRGELPDIVIAGEMGTLHLWPGTRSLDYYPVAPRPLTRLISYVRPYSLQAKLIRPGLQRVRIQLPDKDGTGYLGEMQEFLTAIIEERAPVTPPEDGRRDLQIVLSCYESLDSKTIRDIPPVVPVNPIMPIT